MESEIEVGETQFDKYVIVKNIARGGMGEVSLARQAGPRGFQKVVVIKRILKHLSSDETFIEMFLNEARLAAMLNHPNIVQIFELGQVDDSYFIAMEYIHGVSLRTVKRATQVRELPAPTVAKICAQALHGLHYAHELTDDEGRLLGIVHRDVSPENILVGFNGIVKLLDFGIAKATVGISTTRAGMVKGKFTYMAPEQFTGASVDARADLYGMGVVLYELLTGSRPFTGATEPELIHSILSDSVVPPKVRNPKVPDGLNAIVVKALEKKPENRFSSADHMATALEEFCRTAGEVSNGQIATLMKQMFETEAAMSPMSIIRSQTGLSKSSVGSVRPSSDSVQSTTNRGPSTGGNSVNRKVKSQHTARPREVQPLVNATTDPEVMDADQLGIESIVIETHVPKWVWLGGAAAAVVIGILATAFLMKGSGAPPGIVPPPASVAYLPAPVAGPTPPAVATPPKVAQVPPTPVPVEPAPVPMPVAEAKTPSEEGTEQAPDPSELTETLREPSLNHVANINRTNNRRKQAPKIVPVVVGTKTSEVAIPTRPGTLRVNVNPWAEVFLDGKSLGVTPMDPIELAPGSYTIVLKNGPLRAEKRVSVNVSSDSMATVKADMFDN